MIESMRDLNAEATFVYQRAYEAAMVNYQGTDQAEAESTATGAGRDAEDAFWAQIEQIERAAL
jgi:hypothetical protein